MALVRNRKYCTPKEYLIWLGIPPNRFSDLYLKLWVYEMRELWTKKSDIELLYDIKDKYSDVLLN